MEKLYVEKDMHIKIMVSFLPLKMLMLKLIQTLFKK